MPARHPSVSGGVNTVSPKSAKRLLPVPSHAFAASLKISASVPPRDFAYRNAKTFSMYEVVLAPCAAWPSGRGQGLVMSVAESAGGERGSQTQTKVGVEFNRSEPKGPTPAV